MLRVLAFATAFGLFLQVSDAAHSHDDHGTPGGALQHATCAACLLSAASPAWTGAPDCPAAPVAWLFASPATPRDPIVAAHIVQPPARAPPRHA